MRRVWISLLVLLACVLLAAGWYAYDRGFTRKWRGYVAGEFRKRGVELWVSKMTLDPFRGIIAKNVKVFDARDRRRVLARIDEMRLVINWANLASGKTFLDALELTDATLSLPLDDDPQGEKIEITGLSGRLFLPPQQVYLSRLQADLFGVHVTASGRLINPQKLRTAGSGDTIRSSAAGFAAGLIKQWREAKFFDAAPELHLRFSGDLAEPDKLVAEATFWAGKLTYRKVPLEELYIAANFRDGRLELNQLTAKDAVGALQLSGEYDLRGQTASVSLRSTLDIARYMRAFGHIAELEHVVVQGAPAIDLTVRGRFSGAPTFQLLGHITAPRFTYRGEQFHEAEADFSWNGERWSARDLRVVHHTGALTGDILHLPGDVRTRLKSSIDSAVLRPLLSDAAVEWLGDGS